MSLRLLLTRTIRCGSCGAVEYGLEEINAQVSQWMLGGPEPPQNAAFTPDSIVWNRLYSRCATHKTPHRTPPSRPTASCGTASSQGALHTRLPIERRLHARQH
eukprot:1195924-Prorocentrum_minimum.AAC.7